MHYSPFGLTMEGVSSRAFKGNDYSPNRKKFNGIEETRDLDVNQYDAFFRTLDPQVGRFLQLDPKIESAEAWSPYVAMLNNPIRFSDPLGDSAIKPGYWQGVFTGISGFFGGIGNKIKSNFNNPVQTIKDGLNPINGLKALGQLLPVGRVVDDTKTIVSFVNNLTEGKTFEAGKIGGEKAGEALLSGGVMALTWGVGKGISFGAPASTEAGATLSPNVQKVVDGINSIKAEGGTLKINPLAPNQEINMTIQKGAQKLNLRIETHTVPAQYGGNGITPQRHMNVDLLPNKNILPNKGHKILE